MMAYSQEAKEGQVTCADLYAERHPPFHFAGNMPQKAGSIALTEKFNSYNFPVMMVPVHNTNIVHSDFFKTQLEAALTEITNAKLIIAIGYNFGDRAFLEGLKKLNLEDKEIILVSGIDFSRSPNECPAFNVLSSFWKGSLFLFQGEKFSGFVNCIGPGRPAEDM